MLVQLCTHIIHIFVNSITSSYFVQRIAKSKQEFVETQVFRCNDSIIAIWY